jgi:rhodanese-related sulfurtransferase
MDVRCANAANAMITGLASTGTSELPSHDKKFRQGQNNVVLYRGSGGRAALAGEMLKDLGYERVYNLGGFKDWTGPRAAVQWRRFRAG